MEKVGMFSKKISLVLRIFLFTNILLLLSSIFYFYKNFYIEILIGIVLIFISGKFKRLYWLSFVYHILFYISFLFWNTNYLFVLFLCIVIGLFILNIFDNKLNVHILVYSLIPIFLFLHILWWNFLPLGFDGEYVLEVGMNGDTDNSRHLFLIEGKDVGPRTCIEDECFRTVNGTMELRFNPEIVLDDNTYATVEIEGNFEDDTYLIIGNEYYPVWLKDVNITYSNEITKPVWNIEINKTFEIDFTKNLEEQGFIFISPDEIKKYDCNGHNCYRNGSLVDKEILVIYGNMSLKPTENGLYFDGIDDRIVLLGSYDRFENESFAFNIIGEIDDINRNTTQIIGHYNWEVWADKGKIKTTIGRMNNATGPFFTDSFNYGNHSFNLTYVYEKVDNKIITNNKTMISEKNIKGYHIYNDYGNYDLSLGWTNHNYGKSDYFNGNIKSFKYGKIKNKSTITSKYIQLNNNKIKLNTIGEFETLTITTQ